MAQVIEFVTNHPLLTFGWVFLAGAVLLDFYRSMVSPVKPLKPAQATQLVNRHNGRLLDIRSDADFRKGHIAGAHHISSAAIEKGEFGGLENDKASPLIVVCTSGMTATKAARQLSKAGFEQVNVLSGGMQAWVGDKLPVTKGR